MTANYLFHGTCLSNAKSILENGFDGNEGEQIWNVSAGYNYFWSLKDVAKSEKQEVKYTDSLCMQFAQDAAESAVVQNNCSHLVIFQVRASAVNYEPDDSCPNMSGAVVSREPIPASAIEKIWISNDVTYFKPFMLADSLGHPLRNYPELPQSLCDAAEAITKAKVEFYTSEYIEMEPSNKNQILSM